MAETADMENPKATYEKLAELEKDFEDTELEIVRRQTVLQAPLYERRRAIIAEIDHFWSLVMDEAPGDIEGCIQPSDSQLLNHLKDLVVTRFEIPPFSQSPGGHPRSVSLKFTFTPNDHFEDEVLEKKFWFRRGSDGRAELVSEPVRIRWNKGKDLTGGLTDAAFAAWEAERRASRAANGSASGQEKKAPVDLPEYDAIRKLLDSETGGALSFFTFFAYRGRHISAEESAAAFKDEAERRAKIKRGEEVVYPAPSDDLTPLEQLEMEIECGPGGDDLAIAISEDLYPNAMKYFMDATRSATDSEADFEEDDAAEDGVDEDEDGVVNIRELVKRGKDESGDEAKPKKKKRRTSLEKRNGGGGS